MQSGADRARSPGEVTGRDHRTPGEITGRDNQPPSEITRAEIVEGRDHRYSYTITVSISLSVTKNSASGNWLYIWRTEALRWLLTVTGPGPRPTLDYWHWAGTDMTECGLW